MLINGILRALERRVDQRQPGVLGSHTISYLYTGPGPFGQALETSLARVIAPSTTLGPKVRAVGQAVQSNLARSITPIKAAAPPAPAPTVRRVALARYTLEVAWEAHAKGVFVIGSSTIGGTDTLGVSPFDITFAGPHDDLSALFRGGKIRRGRDDDRAFVMRGEALIVVRDRQGLLNPENLASPLQGLLEGRYQPVRLRARAPNGDQHPLFYGFLERLEWQPLRRDPAAGIATLRCRDLLLWLAEARPVIPSTGLTTTGAAIGKVLDAIGWIEPSGRSLQTGDVVPDFSADGTKSALDLIGELLEAERGLFYIDAAGRAVYQDRLTRTLKASTAMIEHEMSSAVPAIDHSRRRSRVSVKRTQSGFTATATDEAARTVLGDRDLPLIETPYLTSDSQAQALASFILAGLASPLVPLRDLRVDNRTEALLIQTLARELGDVVTVAAAGAQIPRRDFIIESLEHRIDSRRASHAATWLLSEHETVKPFRIGTSRLVSEGAAGDALVY